MTSPRAHRRRPRARALALALATVVLAMAPTACSSDDDGGDAAAGAPTASAGGTTTDTAVLAATTTTFIPSNPGEEAAAGVCAVLVDFDDVVARAVNDASDQITTDTDPDQARALLLDATEDIRAASDELPQRYADLSLSDEGDIGRLVRDAGAAAAAVDEQLDTITDELENGLPDEGPREILSAVFIDMEKVQSLAQPDQTDYRDPALVAALDTLPDCEHTISR